ncbi:unnamed protein product [Prunus brigantina]
MAIPKTVKDIRSLTGRVAAPTRFISKATDRRAPFFKALKGSKRSITRTAECDKAFSELKEYMSRAPLITKEGAEHPVHYVSKALQDAEARYSDIEKLAFALVVSARRLRPYFQAHTIYVLTNHPLRQPDPRRRPRHCRLDSALVDLVCRWLFQCPWMWSCGLVLISPDKVVLEYALRFKFHASNNEAEYEALLAGLRHADALARLASAIEQGIGRNIHMEILDQPSTRAPLICAIDHSPTWMDPILQFLQNQTLPADPAEARRVRYRSARYLILNGALYKRGFSLPYLRCLTPEEPEPLTAMVSPWPFAQWGLDLIGPMPEGKGQVKYAVVAVDYFTKWAEAEALATITAARIETFVWQNIVCRFGIPNIIVTDNGRQFDNAKFKQFCSNLKIKLCFASPAHPQSNGQVEAVNKIIKRTLKTKLDKAKGCWPELLPEVLWSYRTTFRTSTGETPFSLSFGTEAVAPVEIGQPTYRTSTYEAEANDEQLALNLDFIDELRDQSNMRNVSLATKNPTEGTLGPTWEGPYEVTRISRPGAYQLRDPKGKTLPRPWNADHLKYYYK